MREGILGGTFDPIHNGHLHVAAEALRGLALDGVLFIPARVPPHKRDRPLSDARHRLRMVTLAVENRSHFEVSDIELKRSGPSYSVDPVAAEKERLGGEAEIFFLVGADQAGDLATWHHLTRLVGLCRIVPVNRPGFSLDGLEELTKVLSAKQVRELKSSVLDIPPMDVSATDVRRRVREGDEISGMVPAAVERYIRDQGLYRD